MEMSTEEAVVDLKAVSFLQRSPEITQFGTQTCNSNCTCTCMCSSRCSNTCKRKGENESSFGDICFKETMESIKYNVPIYIKSS